MIYFLTFGSYAPDWLSNKKIMFSYTLIWGPAQMLYILVSPQVYVFIHSLTALFPTPPPLFSFYYSLFCGTFCLILFLFLFPLLISLLIHSSFFIIFISFYCWISCLFPVWHLFPFSLCFLFLFHLLFFTFVFPFLLWLLIFYCYFPFLFILSFPVLHYCTVISPFTLLSLFASVALL